MGLINRLQRAMAAFWKAAMEQEPIGSAQEVQEGTAMERDRVGDVQPSATLSHSVAVPLPKEEQMQQNQATLPSASFEHPGKTGDQTDSDDIQQIKQQILDRICEESWSVRLQKPITFWTGDLESVYNVVHYEHDIGVLSFSGDSGFTSLAVTNKELSIDLCEQLDKAYSYFQQLEALRVAVKENAIPDCTDMIDTIIEMSNHNQSQSLVKGIGNILTEFDILGNDPTCMRLMGSLRQNVGLPTLTWEQCPDLDGDELDWLCQTDGKDALPDAVAQKFPMLEMLKDDPVELQDTLGYLRTLASCKFQENNGIVHLQESDSVYQGEEAYWHYQSLFVDRDPSKGVMGGRPHDAGVFYDHREKIYIGYRYDAGDMEVIRTQNPFFAFALAKTDMDEEQMLGVEKALADITKSTVLTPKINVQISLDPIYLTVQFQHEGHDLGKLEIGASQLAQYLPLSERLTAIADSMMQLYDSKLGRENALDQVLMKMQEQHINKLYLVEPIAIDDEYVLTAIQLDKDQTSYAVIQHRDEAMIMPVSVLPTHLQELAKEHAQQSLSAISQKLSTMATRKYRDAQLKALGELSPAVVNGWLMCRLKEKGVDNIRFAVPFCMRHHGQEYNFMGMEITEMNGYPEISFRIVRENVELEIAMRDLPESMALSVLTESMNLLDIDVSTMMNMSKLQALGQHLDIVPTEDSNYGVVLEEANYLSDVMQAYGVEQISFETPLSLGDLKVHDVATGESGVTVKVELPKGKKSRLFLTELTESEVRAISEQCMDAIYSPETAVYRDSLTEKELVEMIGTDKVKAEIPPYGEGMLYAMNQHLMIEIPGKGDVPELLLPWSSLNSTESRDIVEDVIRARPLRKEGEQILYKDDNCRLVSKQDHFVLEGKVEHFDVTEACHGLQELGVVLTQCRRESLAAFCHRHTATFDMPAGKLTVQLYRRNGHYELQELSPFSSRNPLENSRSHET